MAIPWLRRLVTVLAGIVLALGLAAGMLYFWQTAGPAYQPIARAVMGLGGLGLGFMLGQTLRPLGRWRPPVPASVESAAPLRENLVSVWLRGFAAGFWALALFLAALALFYSLLLLPAAGLGLFVVGQPILLLFGGLFLLVPPMAIARGSVAAGEGLPRWTAAAAATAACLGELGACVAAGVCVALLGPWSYGAAVGFGALLTLAAVPVAAAGTPALARLWRPFRGAAWSFLLALLSLVAAWQLYLWLAGWIGALGSTGGLLWLVPGCLLWSGSMGTLLAVAAARRQAAVSRDGSAGPHRVSWLALAMGGLGMFFLGLIPMGLWILSTFLPRPMAPPAAMSYTIPNPTQIGGLAIPGPALTYPAAGAALTGPAQMAPMPGPSTPVWTFTWRPPRGAAPGDTYQFILWPPGAVTPVVQVVVPGTQLRISASAPLLSSRAGIGPPGRSAAMAPARRWPSGPWTWRVRLVRPGQGAGQWSEARPFLPVWGQTRSPGSQTPPGPPPFPGRY